MCDRSSPYNYGMGVPFVVGGVLLMLLVALALHLHDLSVQCAHYTLYCTLVVPHSLICTLQMVTSRKWLTFVGHFGAAFGAPSRGSPPWASLWFTVVALGALRSIHYCVRLKLVLASTCYLCSFLLVFHLIGFIDLGAELPLSRSCASLASKNDNGASRQMFCGFWEDTCFVAYSASCVARCCCSSSVAAMLSQERKQRTLRWLAPS